MTSPSLPPVNLRDPRASVRAEFSRRGLIPSQRSLPWYANLCARRMLSPSHRCVKVARAALSGQMYSCDGSPAVLGPQRWTDHATEFREPVSGLSVYVCSPYQPGMDEFAHLVRFCERWALDFLVAPLHPYHRAASTIVVGREEALDRVNLFVP